MVQDAAKKIIQNAIGLRAQDIYFIPQEDNYALYMRIANQRQLIAREETSFMQSLISHFKFVAGMSVGEKRRIQLGACDYDLGADGEISLRLSSVGDFKGRESLVIRLLYGGQQDLRYWFDGLSRIRSSLGGRGLYLFAGPVGSGKTTLMYQLVREAFGHKQIITIEDPVEIKQSSMLQLQLNPSIDMTYDNLIKLSLRHRPDILIIGEIRDSQTARAVIRASLTGAMVFSTIHAKSIPGVYERLLELGVSQAELDNCLQLIVYQRLIGGGGVIDLAKENFQDHSAQNWNQQIDQLAAAGYLEADQAKTEKIKP